MFNLYKFIADSMTLRPVNKFGADIEANKEKQTEKIKKQECMCHWSDWLLSWPFIKKVQ